MTGSARIGSAAAVARARSGHRRGWRVPGVARRRLTIAAEVLAAIAVCLAGYYVAAGWFRLHEARWVVTTMHALGVGQISGVLPEHLLIFRDDGTVLNGQITTSCSSVLTVFGLVALTMSLLRSRGPHAVGALLGALVAVVAANHVRLVLSTLAGYWWGSPAMALFHDWVGTVWTLGATLGGFLLMVSITLPAAERAEQDAAGQHTARRPRSWARPGLGYRTEELDPGTGPARRTITGWIHRSLLPRSVSRRLAARREAERIDYRIGHLPPDERAETVRRLAADGLGAHTASLLAVATYDEDPEVLDALAEAIAARQWEPVTNDRIAALRLWARGWLFRRRTGTRPPSPPCDEPAEDTLAVRGPVGRPPVPRAPLPDRPRTPSGFARPGAPSMHPRAAAPGAAARAAVAPVAAWPAAAAPPRDQGDRALPAVVVTGAGGPAGIAVIRRLVALGHRVVAVDADWTAAGHHLAEAAVTVPRADHPRFLDALLGAAVSSGADALVCTVAEELPALIAGSSRLASAGLATWLPHRGAAELCCDKAAFAEAMRDRGIAHPATATTPRQVGRIPGPWVVKPRRGRGSRGVQLLADEQAVMAALADDPGAIAQTRLTGREFTADALIDRHGEPVTVVPRWRDQIRAGISVRGTTFDSQEVTGLVCRALAAVGLTGPANVQGFVADDGTPTVVEINPRFSGGLPLTLAAGADVVSAYLTGIRDPQAQLPPLWFTPGVRMSRYFAEVYTDADGRAVPDPCSPAPVTA